MKSQNKLKKAGIWFLDNLPIIVGLFFIVLIISMDGVSAAIGELSAKKVNTNVTLPQTSDSATYQNISSIILGNGTLIVFNPSIPMTKDGNDYYYVLDSSYVQSLGKYCVNGFGDDVDDPTWSYCFLVTPTGVEQGSFFNNPVLIILSLISLIILGMAIYFKMPPLGFIGSILMMVLGVYIMIYGFNNYTDLYTRGVAGSILGVGLIFMIFSAYEWYTEGQEEGEE